jgi:hypothetical protein
MEECPFDGDDHDDVGHTALIDYGAPNILIPNNKRSTGNAKRFPMTGNKEDQADAGLLQHVVEGVYPAVAAAIRNGKRHVVESSHESRAISLWREIDRAEPIGRANHDKWRRCDKSPTMAVQLVQDLAGEPSVCRPDMSS